VSAGWRAERGAEERGAAAPDVERAGGGSARRASGPDIARKLIDGVQTVNIRDASTQFGLETERTASILGRGERAYAKRGREIAEEDPWWSRTNEDNRRYPRLPTLSNKIGKFDIREARQRQQRSTPCATIFPT